MTSGDDSSRGHPKAKRRQYLLNLSPQICQCALVIECPVLVVIFEFGQLRLSLPVQFDLGCGGVARLLQTTISIEIHSACVTRVVTYKGWASKGLSNC